MQLPLAPLPMPKLGILISGRGSNMMALHRHIQQGVLNAEIAVVISNKPTAGGLEYAKENGINAQVFEPKAFASPTDYEAAIVAELQANNVDLVVLAGYMKLVGEPILTAYQSRMVNIHPSLLPSFKGLNAQKQALDYGVTVAGCTVHYVTKDMDAGPIIMQAAVPVLPDDTEASLSERILVKEHEIFALAIQDVLNKIS